MPVTRADEMDALFPGETLLEDDYPIYGDYMYVVDGKPYRSDFHGITARELRIRLKAREVRRCNLTERLKAMRAQVSIIREAGRSEGERLHEQFDGNGRDRRNGGFCS